MNPQAIVGVALLWIASLMAVGAWQNETGQTQVRAVWAAADNKALKAANVKITELNDEARRKERIYAQNQADITKILERERQDAKRKTAALITSYRAGAFSLRDPGTRSAHPTGSQGSATTTAPSGGDGGTPGELSGTAAEFLFDLTADADDVVRQLDACQAVIVSDRSIK